MRPLVDIASQPAGHVRRPSHFIDPDDDPCAERELVDPLDDVDRRQL